MAPHWDRDFDDDANDFEPEPASKRRHMYGRMRVPPKPKRTWNGNDVEKMETDHIMNSILFCEKRFAEAKTNFEKCFPEAVHAFYFESVYEMFPDYTHLRDEWDNRNSK